jgi:ferritin
MKDDQNLEEEEWRKSKEVDYEDMSKSEINDLIDQALDDRDFGRVKFLSQYLKESFEITDDMKAGIQKFCDTLVSFIVDNYYVL